MKLNRSIEAWDKCDAGAMSKMSEAAIKYAFADAKQDIKKMAAIQAQLVAALKEIYDDVKQGAIPNHDDQWWESARAALAIAGAQP